MSSRPGLFNPRFCFARLEDIHCLVMVVRAWSVSHKTEEYTSRSSFAVPSFSAGLLESVMLHYDISSSITTELKCLRNNVAASS